MPRRITLQNLIDTHVIEVPFRIFGTFKGENFSAEIDKDGFILFEGKRYTSLSVTAGIIRAKLSGKPKDGLAYRRANGWIFWHYIDKHGNKKKVDELRK